MTVLEILRPLAGIFVHGPSYVLDNVSHLAFAGMVAVAGASFVLARRWDVGVRIVGFGMLAGGLLFWEVMRRLLVDLTGEPTPLQVRLLFTGPVLCLLAVTCLLGWALRRAAGRGRFSWRTGIAVCATGAVATSLTMFHDQWVDRHVFDPEAPRRDSDYIHAHGWPSAFVADTSDERPNLPGLPGDRILARPLVRDWIVCSFLVAFPWFWARRWAARGRSSRRAPEASEIIERKENPCRTPAPPSC